MHERPRSGGAEARPLAIRVAASAALALVLATGMLTASRRASGAASEARLVPARFAREVGQYRFTGARFSVSRRHADCPARLPAGGTIPRSACPAPPAELANSNAVKTAGEGAGADPLHPGHYAAALVDIFWADPSGKYLDRSISYLESAARLTAEPALVLADLSGAHLARAEVRQAPEDLFHALDAATRSLRMEPGNAVACFNRALALEYIGLDGNAAKAWEQCAMAEEVSGWGIEARRRAEKLASTAADTTVVAPPPPGASTAAVEAFVAAAPAVARRYGWGEVLGAWGAAVLRGDSAGARRNLALAGAVADALARRGGDRSLADAVGAIHRSTHTPEARQRLARAHVAYARGVQAYAAEDHTAAGPFVEEVMALRPPSEALRVWTRRLEELVRLANGQFVEAAAGLAATANQVDTVRHPALAASLHQSRGTALLRASSYAQAHDAWSFARRLFLRAGEPEDAAGTAYLLADVEFLLGTPEAHVTMHGAVAALRTYRRSKWHYTALSVLAMELADAGLPYAARAVYDEGLVVARAIGPPFYEAELRLQRAPLLVALGERRAAQADVDTAESIVRRLPPGERRNWFQADLNAARAVLLLGEDPRRAVAEMDSLLAVRSGARTGPRILAGLVGRAQAHLASGNVERATADLDSATRMISAQQDSIAKPLLRSSVLEAAKATFDRLVMLRLARGDTVGALRSLERGRLSLARRGAASSERWVIPAGAAVLDYALVGDTLLAWAVTPRGVALHRRTLSRAEFLRRLERLRTALEAHESDAELRPLLAALYGELVQPLRAALPPGARLSVVADGELADVPFAALYDASTRKYLVELHAVVGVSSLRDVSPASARPPAATEPALFVSDPAFDLLAHPGFSRLPGAAPEVAAAAPRYRNPMLLAGADADVEAVTAGLRRAAVFHFAGHTVFDDARPERSFLLLAAAPAEPGGGRLTAAAVAEMRLAALRVVVLSSCETLRSPGGRSGGFAGLAGALLAAGADGVVGSPWRVRDGVSRQLMADFHAGYRRTGDAAESLRDAQLLALRSHDPALRTPAAWGAFRYVAN